MRKVLGSFVLLTSMAASTFGAAPRINHTPLSCISDDANPKIVAKIAGARAARVYFRAAGEQTEYWVEMRQRGSDFWTVLPYLCQRNAVSYRIVANGDADATTPEYNVPLRNDCAAFKLDAEESAVAQNLVVGVARAARDDEKQLRGFRCRGVVQRVSTSGEMGRFDDCTDCLIVSSPAGPIVAGVIAGAVTGIVIDEAIDDNEGDQLPVSVFRP